MLEASVPLGLGLQRLLLLYHQNLKIYGEASKVTKAEDPEFAGINRSTFYQF